MKTNKILLASLLVAPLFASSCQTETTILDLPVTGDVVYNYGTNTATFKITDNSAKWADSIETIKNSFVFPDDLDGKTYTDFTRVDDNNVTVKFAGNITQKIDESKELKFDIKKDAFKGAKVEKAHAEISFMKSGFTHSYFEAEPGKCSECYMEGTISGVTYGKFSPTSVTVLGSEYIKCSQFDTAEEAKQPEAYLYSDKNYGLGVWFTILPFVNTLTNQEVTVTINKAGFKRIIEGIDANLEFKFTVTSTPGNEWISSPSRAHYFVPVQ